MSLVYEDVKQCDQRIKVKVNIIFPSIFECKKIEIRCLKCATIVYYDVELFAWDTTAVETIIPVLINI